MHINGEPVARPGATVRPGDVVTVDGRKVEPQTHPVYLLYHKPRGLLCARLDPRGRPLIYDALDVPPNVQSVGRLDMDSEGLLLLTNDGALAHALMRPETRLPRTYRVRVAGHPDEEALAKLQTGGIDIGRGEISDPWEVVVDAETRSHAWLTVTIRRGRWREVRRTLDALGFPVRRLIRTGFGPLTLDPDLPRGAFRPLNRREIEALRRLCRSSR